MNTSTHIVHDAFDIAPPHMRTSNEKSITEAPCETTCYTSGDVVWDSNFPRGLEVVSHGNWSYGPRGDFDL